MRFRRILKTVLTVVIVIGLGLYAYHQSRTFILGPTLTVAQPENGSTLQDSFITISGTARHVSYLSLNNYPIYTDEQGAFAEKLLLLPGYNIITITARDKFGRTTEETLELVLHETSSTTPEPSSRQ